MGYEPQAGGLQPNDEGRHSRTYGTFRLMNRSRLVLSSVANMRNRLPELRNSFDGMLPKKCNGSHKFIRQWAAVGRLSWQSICFHE